jgi:hypothetical protein
MYFWQITLHNQRVGIGQTLYCPTNAHNVKNVELLKHFKIDEAPPTCFGLKRNHHQGATAST